VPRLAVSPVGFPLPPSFLKRSEAEATLLAKRVIKSRTSVEMRFLMRLNAEVGTARKADVSGYYVGGKTGTAEKVINGRYAKKKVLAAFTGMLPTDNPRFQIFVILDEPQGLPETTDHITSGWNAVPTGARVITSIATLLQIEPRFGMPPAELSILARIAKDGYSLPLHLVAHLPTKWRKKLLLGSDELAGEAET
jgi:cell division protein FtsI (penicillin-binding protein 3)